MCLIKKHKKYQYLYLKSKIKNRISQLDLEDSNTPDGLPDEYYYEEKKRLEKIYIWLFNLNKKYNYA